MDKIKGEVCRLCLSVVYEDFHFITSIQTQMLNIILPQLNINVLELVGICSNCLGRVEKAFSFKSVFLEIEDNIHDFRQHEEQVELDKVIGIDCILDGQSHTRKVCRTCLNLLEDEPFVELRKENKSLMDILRKCLPELDIQLTKDPVICQTCSNTIENNFNFISLCLNNEEKIKSYLEVIGQTEKIDLHEAVRYMWSKDSIQLNKIDVDIKEEDITQPSTILCKATEMIEGIATDTSLISTNQKSEDVFVISDDDEVSPSILASKEISHTEPLAEKNRDVCLISAETGAADFNTSDNESICSVRFRDTDNDEDNENRTISVQATDSETSIDFDRSDSESVYSLTENNNSNDDNSPDLVKARKRTRTKRITSTVKKKRGADVETTINREMSDADTVYNIESESDDDVSIDCTHINRKETTEGGVTSSSNDEHRSSCSLCKKSVNGSIMDHQLSCPYKKHSNNIISKCPTQSKSKTSEDINAYPLQNENKLADQTTSVPSLYLVIITQGNVPVQVNIADKPEPQLFVTSNQKELSKEFPQPKLLNEIDDIPAKGPQVPVDMCKTIQVPKASPSIMQKVELTKTRNNELTEDGRLTVEDKPLFTEPIRATSAGASGEQTVKQLLKAALISRNTIEMNKLESTRCKIEPTREKTSISDSPTNSYEPLTKLQNQTSVNLLEPLNKAKDTTGETQLQITDSMLELDFVVTINTESEENNDPLQNISNVMQTPEPSVMLGEELVGKIQSKPSDHTLSKPEHSKDHHQPSPELGKELTEDIQPRSSKNHQQTLQKLSGDLTENIQILVPGPVKNHHVQSVRFDERVTGNVQSELSVRLCKELTGKVQQKPLYLQKSNLQPFKDHQPMVEIGNVVTVPNLGSNNKGNNNLQVTAANPVPTVISSTKLTNAPVYLFVADTISHQPAVTVIQRAKRRVIKIGKDIIEFKCQLFQCHCGYATRLIKNVRRHIADYVTNHEFEELIYCVQCFVPFRTEFELQCHYFKCAMKNEPDATSVKIGETYFCLICSFESHDKDEALKHFMDNSSCRF